VILPIPTDVERIDLNDDGTVDDVAISLGGGMFRLEQMSANSYWLCVYMPDGEKRHVFWLTSKKRIEATHRVEDL